MIRQFIYVYKFCNYYLFARHKKGHGIHSPFVFNIVLKIFNAKNGDSNLEKTHAIYDNYKRSELIIEYKDLGAGSILKKNRQIHLGNIIKKSSVNKKYGALLYYLVRYFKPQHILELGTSVGISAAYIAQGAPDTNFKSIEGAKEKTELAKKITGGLNQRIEFINGNFDDILDSVLDSFRKLDFVFFDGNHRKESTLKYFNSCIEKIHDDSIFVFDDIHWSEEMEEAWDAIKDHQKVRLSIDIFRMGLIFFKKELSYEHYVIKF